jgi:hypothetical protein
MLPAVEPLRFTEGVGKLVRTLEKERALIVDGIDRDCSRKALKPGGGYFLQLFPLHVKKVQGAGTLTSSASTSTNTLTTALTNSAAITGSR